MKVIPHYNTLSMRLRCWPVPPGAVVSCTEHALFASVNMVWKWFEIYLQKQPTCLQRLSFMSQAWPRFHWCSEVTSFVCFIWLVENFLLCICQVLWLWQVSW